LMVPAEARAGVAMKKKQRWLGRLGSYFDIAVVGTIRKVYLLAVVGIGN
jgi:hypothetical protein